MVQWGECRASVPFLAPLGGLEGVPVDVTKPAVFELLNEVMSTHPNILKTLGEVGFGEALGDGFSTSANRQNVHIAANVFPF